MITLTLNSVSQTDWELKKFEFNNEYILQYKDSVIRFQYTYDVPDQIIHEWYYWFDSILHMTRGGFNGKLLDGNFEKFDKEGNMLVKGKFKCGLKNWEWKYWNSKGELIKVEKWKDGLESGTFQYWDDDGNIKKEVRYDNGILNGYTIIYSDDTITSKKYYKKGKLVSKKRWLF